MFSTQTNNLEIDLEGVEAKQRTIEAARRSANPFQQLCLKLRQRTAFMASPPSLWAFLVILGLFSAFSLYVSSWCMVGDASMGGCPVLVSRRENELLLPL